MINTEVLEELNTHSKPVLFYVSLLLLRRRRDSYTLTTYFKDLWTDFD
jgi:hypothetical protein